MPPDEDGAQPELEEAPRPDWLNPRYDSVEAQAKAYSEAEKLIVSHTERTSAAERAAAEMSQRLAELEQRVRQQPQQTYDPSTDPHLMMEAQAWEEGDTMRALQLRDQRQAQMIAAYAQMTAQQQPQQPQNDQVSVLLVEQQIQRELGADLDIVKDDVERILTENPHWIRDPSTDPAGAAQDYVRVARMVKAEKLAEQTAQLDTQHGAAVRAKRMAQTATGGGRGDQPAPTDRTALIEAMRKLPRADSLLT